MAGFSLEVVTPRLVFGIENEGEVVRAMGETFLRELSSRLRRNQGAEGPLRAAKDTGRVLDRTGSLRASIAITTRIKKGSSVAIVGATGKRPDDEHSKIRRAKKAARAKTKSDRSRFLAALERGTFSAAESSAFASAIRGVRAGKERHRVLGRIRTKTVTDNASLAAILSAPPKDARSIKGGRKTYPIFYVTQADRAKIEDAVGRVAKYELDQVGTDTKKVR